MPACCCFRSGTLSEIIMPTHPSFAEFNSGSTSMKRSSRVCWYTKHTSVNHSLKTVNRKKQHPNKPQHTTPHIIVQYYNVLCAKLTVYKMKYKHVPGFRYTANRRKRGTLCTYSTHAAHDIGVIIGLGLHQARGEARAALETVALTDFSRVQSITASSVSDSFTEHTHAVPVCLQMWD